MNETFETGMKILGERIEIASEGIVNLEKAKKNMEEFAKKKAILNERAASLEMESKMDGFSTMCRELGI